MGVVISSTEDGVGSSCEITSWAQLREAEPNSRNSISAIVNITNIARGASRRPIGETINGPFCSFMTHLQQIGLLDL